ncbi:MAG: hypothetical protein HKO02_11835 [Hyphomonadaceae bacterium]|nr:hypothetical protein [Hyphomonadaceae bacterium]
MALLSSAIVIPIVHFDLKELTIGITTPLILGTAISIFLGFRTNSAYVRWFRGKDLYGDLISNVRMMGLLIHRIKQRHFIDDNVATPGPLEAYLDRLIKRAIAYCWIVGDQLKDKDPFKNEHIKPLLSKPDLKRIKAAHNPALKTLFLQAEILAFLENEKAITGEELEEFTEVQREIVRIQTEAEDLKQTPFPTHYSYFTNLFVWLLVVLLSLSLPANENSGYYAIPLVVLIGWIFSMIEGIGSYMDMPWIDNRNVVPTDYLNRKIERDLRAYVLGETKLPDEIKPIDGALY